jgi:membrane dipeptidase
VVKRGQPSGSAQQPQRGTEHFPLPRIGDETAVDLHHEGGRAPVAEFAPLPPVVAAGDDLVHPGQVPAGHRDGDRGQAAGQPVRPGDQHLAERTEVDHGAQPQRGDRGQVRIGQRVQRVTTVEAAAGHGGRIRGPVPADVTHVDRTVQLHVPRRRKVPGHGDRTMAHHPTAPAGTSVRLVQYAAKVTNRLLIIDGHNDLPWALRIAAGSAEAVSLAEPPAAEHTDLPRLAAGGLGAQFWSVYVPCSYAGGAAVTAVLEQIDLTRRMIAAYPDTFQLALTADDVSRAFQAGRIASLMGAEGGHCINESLGVLRMLYALGVRYMTLTHNNNTPWADSATDEPAVGGLNDFGRAVVREMQRIGMLVDLSHVAPATMHAALDVAGAPVIFSHSSARAVCDAPRNVPDDVLARLAGNGGVCMVTFVTNFVSQECADWTAELKAEMDRRGLDQRDIGQLLEFQPKWEQAHSRPGATLAQVADHIEHVRDVAGIAHVGIGGDFDGTDQTPAGLADVSAYPALFDELRSRGWSEQDCAALAGQNLLRALRAAEVFSGSRSGQLRN